MADRVEWIIKELERLTPAFRSGAEQADRERQLASASVSELRRLDLFRLWVPASMGGGGCTLVEALRIYEAAARAEGSVGWLVMIGNGGALFSAHLPPAVARALFGIPEALVAGSGAPCGRAENVEGGLLVDGRWPYASGARHASVFTALCVLADAAETPDGTPALAAVALAPSQVDIVDTWNTSGMRGTGSHDIEVQRAFVPAERVFVIDPTCPQQPGTLYRLPFQLLTELPVAAVALGIGRHMLEAFAQLAHSKRSSGSGATLACDPLSAARYAEAVAVCEQVASSLYTRAEAIWQRAGAGELPGEQDIALCSALCIHGVTRLRQTLEELVLLSGMASTLRNGELARAWRDLQTLAAHGSLNPLRLRTAGASLLGSQNRG
ncbi:MAG: acyl-CoA dehydrogenase family protein [Parahaliea sp.]